MTRRLAITILLTVWAMLIAGGTVAYVVTRSLLLDYFDESLFAYASSVPGLLHADGQTPALTSLGGDRYLVLDQLSRTVARPTTNPAGMEPHLIRADFKFGEGQRLREVVLRAYAKGQDATEPPRPVTVIYAQSAAAFDSRMNDLGIALGLFGIVAGLLTAGVARRVSQVALRPLAETARQIASIDERQLDRRLDPAALPPELTPMADRLNEMLARLETAFAARQRFLADASHELRTPVAALVTGVEVTLRHPRDAAVYQRTLETCLGDARQLRQLVERLMEQVRSENLAHDEPRQEISLNEFLNECARSVAPLAGQKGLDLYCVIAPGLRYSTTPGRLRSVVMNLLSNAIEYNRPGGRIELACTVDAGDGVTLRVSDTGVGIAPEQVPQLFEPFFRADKSRQNDNGHMGLGLSIVQAHVQAMNGVCRVESELGEGTTFYITLPASCPTASQSPSGDKDMTNEASHVRLIQA